MRQMIIHREKYSDAEKDMKYIFDRLNVLFPNAFRVDFRRMHILSQDQKVLVEFRCGSNPCLFSGLCPSFWMSDCPDVSWMLELGACKVGGKRLRKIEQAVNIIAISWLCDLFIDNIVNERQVKTSADSERE